MTAAEDARVLRAAAEVLGRIPARTRMDWEDVQSAVVLAADELDPPAPSPPTEFGWHPEVRHRHFPDDFLPGALHTRGGWLLVYLNGGMTFRTDEEIAVTEVQTDSAPRVLQATDPCPPIGSVWVDTDQDEFTIVGVNQIRWSKRGCTYDTNWARSAYINWPVTEVLT